MANKAFFIVFLASGIFALVCIPLILLGERGLIPLGDEFFRLPQFMAAIVCFIFGVTYLVLSRKQKSYTKILAWTGTVLSGLWIAFIVCFIGYLLFGPIAEDYMHSMPFDAQQWKAQSDTDHSDWPTRLCMVDDLIASKKLNGLSRDEVLDLLGEPFAQWDGRRAGPQEQAQAGPNDIYYHLGPERGFIRIDSEWLVIEFDKNNEVETYWIYTD